MCMCMHVHALFWQNSLLPVQDDEKGACACTYIRISIHTLYATAGAVKFSTTPFPRIAGVQRRRTYACMHVCMHVDVCTSSMYA